MPIIYVYLLDEGTDVWRPVPAKHIAGDVYLLGGEDFYDEEDELWEFPPGSRIVAERQLRVDSGGKKVRTLVAVRRADSAESDQTLQAEVNSSPPIASRLQALVRRLLRL